MPAHAKRIVHRDLKPANIFVCKMALLPTTSGARIPESPGPYPARCARPNQNAVLLGTRNTWHQSKRWEELGGRCTNRSVCAGRNLVRVAERPTSLLRAWRSAAFDSAAGCAAPPTALADRGLNDVVMRALSKDPAHRFPTLRAFVEATGVEDMSGAFHGPAWRGKRTQATRITEELPPPQSVVVLTDAKMSSMPQWRSSLLLQRQQPWIPSIIPSSVVAAADPGSLVTVPTGNVVPHR